MEKKDIKDFTLKELGEEFAKLEEPAYRAEQIFFWIYRKGARDFREMKNLPRLLKDKLEKLYYISEHALLKSIKSSDGTEKFVFKLYDGNLIESVLIPSGVRKTICISTQVGCKFGCAFCASGLKGFIRNLAPAEIVNQIVFAEKHARYKITNCVLMGMGEPLDNYENVMKAVKIMNEPKGMKFGARRITVSTCGLVEGIEKLVRSGLRINLSISLHAGNDKLRNELVPINRRYPLEKLIESCRDYTESTGRIITLEYVLVDSKNDSLKDANELAIVAKKLKAKVNLIPCSHVSGLDFRPPSPKKIEMFEKELVKKKVAVTLRESKGADVKAACGQLAGGKT